MATTVPEETRAGLYAVAMADSWSPVEAAGLVEVALRRWFSQHRRLRPAHRTPDRRRLDLRRGLKQRYGDDLYLEPGWLDHVADRFAGYLLGHTPPE